MTKHNVFDKPDTIQEKELLVRILQSEPPYKSMSFDYDLYTKFGFIEDIRIDAYCENCDAEKVFCNEIKENLKEIFTAAFKVIGGPPGSRGPSASDFFKDKEYFVNMTLYCAKCGEPHYYSLLFKGNTVTKIGQYPSFAKISAHDLKKYKNMISKYYPELTKSVNAYSQGMGVAAFVYLRRILEHLIETKYNGDPSWKFIDKLKEVEKTEQIIPSELSEIKEQIYSILSKGVHEYEEDECIQLYIAVKFVVEQILDLELEKKTRSTKAKEAMKAIQGKLQEDKKNG